MFKGPITCHVLDVSIGKPAEGVDVTLQVYHDKDCIGVFNPLAHGVTDSDGRCVALLPPHGSEEAKQAGKTITTGIYKIVFKPNEYFAKSGRKCFYPWVEIPFQIENPEEHYHIPLLISPYSFTTYRGS
ncbi:transthyretin [Paxillus ammoniavirescens]|nr:transthyretin [Paxillus ammoniavirescens]